MPNETWQALWLLLLFPLLGSAIAGTLHMLAIRARASGRDERPFRRLAGPVACAALAASFGLAVAAFGKLAGSDAALESCAWPWIDCLRPGRRPDPEAFRQGVARIEHEVVVAGDVGGAGDPRPHIDEGEGGAGAARWRSRGRSHRPARRHHPARPRRARLRTRSDAACAGESGRADD